MEYLPDRHDTPHCLCVHKATPFLPFLGKTPCTCFHKILGKYGRIGEASFDSSLCMRTHTGSQSKVPSACVHNWVSSSRQVVYRVHSPGSTVDYICDHSHTISFDKAFCICTVDVPGQWDGRPVVGQR